MTGEHGTQAEDTVEAICYRLFGRNFVLRSPVLLEVSGPKELTDILVLVDDTAIIIQSKSLEIEASELDDMKFGRIRNRQSRAKRQLNTALNAQTRNAHVRAVSSTGISFNIDWSRIRHRIGVITLNVPDSAYEDPEFRFQYPYPVESYKGIEVHTFMLNDLHLMALELTTPADVILYLRARVQCLETQRFIIGNELDFLAFYKTQYPEIQKALTDPAYLIWITPGYWEDYQKAHAEKLADRNERFKNSALIDRLIEDQSTSVGYSAEEQGISEQEAAINYMGVIGKLGKLTRMERAKIGDKMVEKFNKTETNKWGYFIYVSKLMDIGYLFLFLNEDDRDRRRNFLQFLCEQACHVAPCRELVGVGTDGAQQEGYSFDVMVLDVETTKSETEPDPDFKLFRQLDVGSINEWDT